MPAENEYARTYSARFLPGKGSDYMVSLTRTEQSSVGGWRRYIIQCWDLRASPPACVAQFSTPDLLRFQVNSEEGHDTVLAVTQRIMHKFVSWLRPGLTR